MKRTLPYVTALLLDVVGAGGALLVSLVTWQTLSAGRTQPFRDVTVEMTGRDVDPATTALALVALAGVVAVLATRGVWRRIVGGAVALAGLGLVWRGVTASGAVSAERARSFIESHRQTVSIPEGTTPHVQVHVAWAVLSVACGVLVLVAGLLVAVRGGRWQGMSARYEATPAAGQRPAAEDGDGARAAASLWSALDRGEDPTSDPTSP